MSKRGFRPSIKSPPPPTITNVRRLKNEISATAQHSIDNAFALNAAILNSQTALNSLDAQLREIRAAVIVADGSGPRLTEFLRTPSTKGETRIRALLSTLKRYLAASKDLIDHTDLKTNPGIGERYKVEINYAVSITESTCAALEAAQKRIEAEGRYADLLSVLKDYIPFSDKPGL